MSQKKGGDRTRLWNELLQSSRSAINQRPGLSRGIRAFNKHYENFGDELLFNLAGSVPLILQYKIVTPQNVLTSDDFENMEGYLNSEDYFYKLCFEALIREDPGEIWVLICVTGDGNCFFHSGSAHMSIKEPASTRFHFYDQLRNLICDTLAPCIDDGPCAQTRNISFLQFNHMLIDAEIPPPVDIDFDLDLTGVSPQRGVDQSICDHADEVRAYYARAHNRRVARQSILDSIEAGRIHGSMNTEQQILGLALLTATEVRVYGPNDVRDRVVRMAEFTPDGGVDDTYIPMFLDNEHYITAVPLSMMERYCAPLTPPKTTKTHDGNGNLRLSLETSVKSTSNMVVVLPKARMPYSKAVGRKALSKSSTKAVGPKAASKSRTKTVGRKALSKSSTKAVGPKAASKSRTKNVGPKALSKSRTKTVGPKALSKSRTKTVGPKALSKSRSEAVGPKAASRSRSKAAPKIGAKEDVQKEISVKATAFKKEISAKTAAFMKDLRQTTSAFKKEITRTAAALKTMIARTDCEQKQNKKRKFSKM